MEAGVWERSGQRSVRPCCPAPAPPPVPAPAPVPRPLELPAQRRHPRVLILPGEPRTLDQAGAPAPGPWEWVGESIRASWSRGPLPQEETWSDQGLGVSATCPPPPRPPGPAYPAWWQGSSYFQDPQFRPWSASHPGRAWGLQRHLDHWPSNKDLRALVSAGEGACEGVTPVYSVTCYATALRDRGGTVVAPPLPHL